MLELLAARGSASSARRGILKAADPKVRGVLGHVLSKLRGEPGAVACGAVIVIRLWTHQIHQRLAVDPQGTGPNSTDGGVLDLDREGVVPSGKLGHAGRRQHRYTWRTPW